MAQTVQGVIARAKGAPVELVDVIVPDPGPGEAVVAVQACGVCHTDLHYREGGINDDFPFLLGHEAAGVVESVGEGVTEVAPGRLRDPQLAGGLRPVPGLRRGKPWYCFNTHNAKQKMTLTDGTELSPALGHRRLRRQDPGRSRPVHQGRPVGEARGRRPARLRRDGRAGRGDEHRQRRPRRHRGRDRLRRSRVRGRRRCPPGRRRADHRRRHRRPEARVGQGPRRHPHRAGQGQVRGRGRRGDPGPDRRLRRRRRHRRGRPARDLAAGVLRPRPGRHRRPGRRADAGHAAGHAADRLLRPRRRRSSRSWYGDCLPSPRLPDAGRPAPAGPAAAGGLRHARRSGSATSRPRSRRCTTATSCARSSSCDGCGSTTASRPGRSAWTARPSTSTTTSGSSATTASASSSTPRTTPTRSPRLVGGRTLLAIACTHAHDDHVRVAPELADRLHAPILLHPDDLPLWELTHPDREPDADLADGMTLTVGGIDLEVLHTPGPLARVGLLPGRRPRAGLHRRHALRRRPGRDRAVLLRLPDDHRARSATGCSTLPPETVVHTGHGDDTTIGAEAPHLQEWLDRGH